MQRIRQPLAAVLENQENRNPNKTLRDSPPAHPACSISSPCGACLHSEAMRLIVRYEQRRLSRQHRHLNEILRRKRVEISAYENLLAQLKLELSESTDRARTSPSSLGQNIFYNQCEPLSFEDLDSEPEEERCPPIRSSSPKRFVIHTPIKETQGIPESAPILDPLDESSEIQKSSSPSYRSASVPPAPASPTGSLERASLEAWVSLIKSKESEFRETVERQKRWFQLQEERLDIKRVDILRSSRKSI